jgi:hypothetical protein
MKEASKALVIAKATASIEADVEEANAEKLGNIEAHERFGLCVAALKKDAKADAFPKPLQEACRKLLGAAVKLRHESFTASRDNGEAVSFGECNLRNVDLRGFAGLELAPAETLCNEIGLMADTAKGFKQVQENIEKKTAALPFECLYFPEQLAAIGTDWAKAKREELVKACFIDLGVIILESRDDKKIKDACGDMQKAVYKLYMTDKLAGKSEALDAQIKRYQESGKCD